jgi:FkbM family methyltransferase
MFNVSNSCQVKNLNDIYLKYFLSVNSGTFVEVGAYDGQEFSNTSCLSDIGWKGLYIEPVIEFYNRCLARHKNNNISFENCSIGTIEKEIDIFVNGAITTTSLDQVKTYYDIGWSDKHEVQRCKQFRLDTLLKKYNISRQFELLVVDVEGNETDVFNSFDLIHWYPKMIIVELVDNHETFVTNKQIKKSNIDLRKKITSSGYSEIYSDNINTIFISNYYDRI